MRHLKTLILLLAVAGTVSACIVETPPPPGPDRGHWCYNHPGRC
jgi:hypothetical protein